MTELEALNLILQFSAKHPYLALFLLCVGFVRLLIKPMGSALRWWVAQTPSKRDDRKLEKFLANRWVKAILYVLDWIGSIKIRAAAQNQREGGQDAGQN